MPRSDKSSRVRSADSLDFVEFDAQRARTLRNRIAWCVGVLLFLLALSVWGLAIEYNEYREGKTPLQSLKLGIFDNIALGAILIATLVFVVRNKPSRVRLVRVITLSTLALIIVATVFELLRVETFPTTFLGDPLKNPNLQLLSCQWGLYTYSLLLIVPLLIIPMQWRESGRLVLAAWLAYVGIIVIQAGAPWNMAVGFGVFAILIAIPAMAVSRWLYQRFDAAYRHEQLRGRFGELSAELLQARRLHEALFPPAITWGSVHVTFHYEPMREIGGDFVFVHPPISTIVPIELPRTVFVVVIDVTGHGVASALAVNRLHGELIRFFGEQATDSLSAGNVVAHLNAYVYKWFAPQALYATAWCARVQTTEGNAGARVECCSAGHPPALLRSHDAQLQRFTSTAPMLGVLEPALFQHTSHELTMAAGDRLVAFTDGLFEVQDEDGKQLGIGPLEHIVRAAATNGVVGESQLARDLVAAATKHRFGRATDDALVVEIAIQTTVNA